MPQILSETRDWIVVDKPTGWLSIAGRGEGAPVLLDWLKERFSDVMTVHRLDRETSGVILFARGAEAHRRASLWFQNRETRKFYSCLAQGRAMRPMLKIQRPIEGVACTTQVEIKESFAQSFFGWIRPLTGRRHQIRIHLAEEGHPLLGDSQYGGPKALTLTSGRTLEVARVALHASRLELPSGEKFEAPLPEDFSGWLQSLRAEGRS